MNAISARKSLESKTIIPEDNGEREIKQIAEAAWEREDVLCFLKQQEGIQTPLGVFLVEAGRPEGFKVSNGVLLEMYTLKDTYTNFSKLCAEFATWKFVLQCIF